MALLGGAHEIRADVTVLNHRLFGHLSQYEIGDPETVNREACAPTSTTNYMVYLQNKHPASLGVQLAGQTYDMWKEQAQAWIYEMGTSVHGTFYIPMVEQVQLTLDECLGASSTTDPCVDPPLDPAVDKFTYGGTFVNEDSFYYTATNRQYFFGIPEPTQIKESIERFTPVLTGISYMNGCGGHELLVNGISKDHLHFIDPLNPYEGDPQHPNQKRTKQSIGRMTIIENNRPNKFAMKCNQRKPAKLRNRSMILTYEQYKCGSPYIESKCVEDGTDYYDEQVNPCRAVPSGGCPMGYHEASAYRTTRAWIDNTFTVDFTGAPGVGIPAEGLTEVIPTPAVTPIEKRAHRKWLRCHQAKSRAYDRDSICRRKNSREVCDLRLIPQLELISRNHGPCGDVIPESLGSINHGSASVSLAAAGVDIADIGLKGKDLRCSNAFGRALAKHTRCEYGAQRLEQSGKDGRWKRHHCDHRLRERFHSARKRHGDSCPAPTDLSTVISTNREEATPLTEEEAVALTGNLH